MNYLTRTMKNFVSSHKIKIVIVLSTFSITLNILYLTYLETRHYIWNIQCDVPHLDPFAEEITGFDTDYIAPITCEGQDWVECYHSKCKIIPDVMERVKNIACFYNDIIYENDYNYHLGKRRAIVNDNSYKLTNSDHVKISCVGVPKENLKVSWKGYSSGFRTMVEQKPVTLGDKNYNVMIFGLHSTSKNGFIRSMPKSYKYLTKVMNGTIMNGYNIVGEGIASALFPILTGMTEADILSNMTNTTSLDNIPFLFYKLKKEGYRTAYFDDSDWLPTIFHKQPTDHYLKSLFLEEKSGNWWNRLQNSFCMGSIPQFKFMINKTDQFLKLDGKKFIFTFISDITQERFVRISNADNDMVKLLESLVATKALENTLVMILGDHGVRNANVRNTFQGKLERRLPLLFVLLPEDLKRNRPKVQYMLETNADMLTTPHDVHATILDVLNMKQHTNTYIVPGYSIPRAISLIEPIPWYRSCNAAGVEDNWCACLQWQNLTQTDIMFEKAGLVFLNYVNALTRKVRGFCVERTLIHILWVIRQRPLYRKLKDLNIVEDLNQFNANVTKLSQNYHIKVVLGPKWAEYEASLVYLIDDDSFVITGADITRTHDYRPAPSCVSDQLPHLNPYCYCVDYAINKSS